MKRYFLAILPLALTITTVSGQIQLPKALERPINLALEKSKDIRNKELEVEKTHLEHKAVKSKYIPKIEASGAFAYLDSHITFDIPGFALPITGYELFADKTKIHNRANALHGGVTAKSVLFSGLQIHHGAKALEQKAKGDALMIETDKDDLIVDVVTSFDKIKFIQASEQLIEDSRKRLEKEELRVNAAIENGLAVPFDRDKITLARLELESKQTELEESKNLLFQKISYLTGLSTDEIEEISYRLDPIHLADNLTVENKQELEALEHYQKASEHVLKKEKGTFLPQAAAFAGVSYSGIFNGTTDFNIPYLPSGLPQPRLNLNELSLSPSLMAGVVLKWEIFGGMERKHKIDQAKVNVEQLENKLADSRDKLNLLLLQKLATYRTFDKKIDLANQQERVAQNALTLAGKQYVQGLISINQRLEAENDFVKAAQNKTQILISQREAALEASKVTGKLSEKIQFN